MITRPWREWAPTDPAHEYVEHDHAEVLSVLRGMAGFDRARLRRRTTGHETEFVPLTLVDGLDAARAFAGPDYQAAVVADEARRVLIRFDDHVSHDETAFETS